MVQQIHILFSDLVKVIFSFYAHGRNFHPAAVFPVTSRSGYFPQIHFRIKIRCEGITVIAAVTVQNVNGIDRVKFMFFRIGAVSLCHSRIKSASEKGCQSRLFKFFPVRPLPAIVKIRRETFFFTAFFINSFPLRIFRILRFIICRIHIVDAAGQAGIHNRQILIRQGNIHNQIRLIGFDQCDDLFHIVRVHPGCCNFCGCFSF